jgi:phosphohistidine phosphatase
MTHFLFLLRHAKSDWQTDAATDFERPLSERGLRDAQKMAHWLIQQSNVPATIISSPALRAYQTALVFAHVMNIQPGDISFDKRIYEASAHHVLEIIRCFPETGKSVLLMGHNPGFDSLLQMLCKTAESRADGKLMTTAAIARIRVTGSWRGISDNCCVLDGLTRPKDLH